MALPEFDADVERDALGLFDAALDLATPEREAWLAQHCTGNEALRDRVLALLHADATSGLLGIETGPAAEPPAQIGPYRLEELIASLSWPWTRATPKSAWRATSRTRRTDSWA